MVEFMKTNCFGGTFTNELSTIRPVNKKVKISCSL